MKTSIIKKSAPKYKDSYTDTIEKYINKLMNIEEFSYSPYDDELYAYYKDEYKRRGQRAMEDTLGSFAMQTGGVASNYAVNAASQSYDYYNMKTAEKIPELYKLAYNSYLDGIERNIKGINMFGELSDDEYKRYTDSLKAYEADREFKYGVYKDASDAQYRRDILGRDIYENDRDYFNDVFESSRDYDLELQKYSRDIFENNRDYETDTSQFNEKMNLEKDKFELSEEKTKSDININELSFLQETQNVLYDLAMDRWRNLGYLDPESAEILGLPAGAKTSDYLYKQAQIEKLSR